MPFVEQVIAILLDKEFRMTLGMPLAEHVVQ